MLSAALFVVAYALVLAPWTIRNIVVMDRFVPVTTGGGKALFVATYLPGKGRQLPTKRKLIERFTGQKEVTDKEVSETQMADLLNRVARKYPNLERDAALAKIGRENFRKYVREQPGAYARMVATKMWNVWRRGSGPTMRAGGWIAFHYTVLAFGLVGLGVLAWRRRWEALVLGVLIAGITVLGGVLLAVPRRNVPLMPLVMCLAATGVSWLARQRRGAGWRSAGHGARTGPSAVASARRHRPRSPGDRASARATPRARASGGAGRRLRRPAGRRDSLAAPGAAPALPISALALLEADVAHWELHGFGPWLFRLREDDRPAARGGLWRTVVEGQTVTEVQYAVVSSLWGQGLATEIARASVAAAFDQAGLEELVCFTLTSNTASLRVMEKAGFQYSHDITRAGLPHACTACGASERT